MGLHSPVSAGLKPLSHYDMSEERGFLCRHDARDIELSGDWADYRAVALRLPQLLPTGAVRRHLLSALSGANDGADARSLSDGEARMAFVHLSFMVQAYVWGEADAPRVLPAVLARPMAALSDRIGQPPLLTYSSYVLDNWDRVDRLAPITLDNIHMIQNFLAGRDEAWFVLIHVAIEAAAGRVLAAMPDLVEAAALGDEAGLQSGLEATAEVWEEINGIFDRMPEGCDPYIYFERVRPYIHGWKDNPALKGGIIYEGVERFGDVPQTFRGQTGSQSSIVPSMDALLGVGHAADPLKAYLDELHIYRPPAHRAFIDDVRAASSVRAFVSEAGNSGLTAAYNANVQAVSDFRSCHLKYAASYINRQGNRAVGNHTEVGTGGTPFMRYLKKHRDETAANLL